MRFLSTFYIELISTFSNITDIENDIWTKWPRFSKIIISPKFEICVIGHHMVLKKKKKERQK